MYRVPRLLRLAALTVLACLASIPLAGCSGLRLTASAPAFVKDVDTLRADHDAAIAKVREDEQAARDAFATEFNAALAAGKTTDDALGAAIAAESAKAQGAATAAAQVAIDAKGKAEAARSTSEGSPGWLTLVIGLLGTTGVGGVIAKLLLSNYDKKPFVGSDGSTIAEGPLVDALSRALGVKVTAATPAPAA